MINGIRNKKRGPFVLFFLCAFCASLYVLCAKTEKIELKLIETSDVHGLYLPYNYVELHEEKGSLAHVYSYVKEERKKYGDNLILLDNGDILEGHPPAHYYNYIDTNAIHLCSDMMNYMKYDVGNIGNHDIEAGCTVLDRVIQSCNFPILSANIILESNCSNYTKPYIILEREGLRIAVLGLITQAVPAWGSKTLWDGLLFKDMEEAAQYWMKIIQTKEKPDIIVGLFHSGKEPRIIANQYHDDISLEIAKKIPGFDLIMIGHDHIPYCDKIVNINGDSVLVVNPGYYATAVADVKISVTHKRGKIRKKEIQGKLVDIRPLPPDKEIVEAFSPQHKKTLNYVSQKIGSFTKEVTTRPAYFGPSELIDFIHLLQLSISNADISFASPLSFDSKIEKGDIHISDVFKLYRYNNFIYTMELSGEEIKNYLEESYALWTSQMKHPNDHLLLFNNEKNSKYSFANYYYLFDSAAGIIYTVDVTKPKGEKISIQQMADGTPFDLSKNYKVALTSYRGSGGGELLTRGAGLLFKDLENRIISISDNDFRYYMIEYIKKHKEIEPVMLNHWKFIPEEWVKIAKKKDYNYLFGDEN